MSLSPTTLQRVTGYFAFILIGWNAVLLPSLIRSIEPAFHENDAAFGLLYLLGALFYTVGALGGGFATERIGRRIVLSGGGTLIAVGLAVEGLAPVWLVLLLAAIPASIGAGIIDGGTQGLFLDLFREARGGALNLLHVFFSLGALLAPLAIGGLIGAGVSWRLPFLLVALGGALLALGYFVTPLPSGRKAEHSSHTVELAASERSLLPFVFLAAAIALYVAGELGVSSWLVKYLSGIPITLATAVLSVFWGGMALGRLLSNWAAERFDYAIFIIGASFLASVSLIGALLAPSTLAAAVLFGCTGMFFGPIYPTIMALGGNYYPHRLAALSGSLSAASTAGSMAYPPLMGVLERQIGLRGGMFGAALLGLPLILAIAAASTLERRLIAPLASARSVPPPPDHQWPAPGH